MSIEVAVPRILFFDCVIKTRINAALEFYDAASFYDWVAHNFSSLIDQAFNIPFPGIICYLKSIQ